MERDQQEHPLVRHALDITLESPRGHWSGKTIDVTPSRAKVALAGNSAPPPSRTIVQLRISLPDGNPPLSLPARVIEADPDGVSLSFFNLKDQQVQRLKDHLLSLFVQESQGLLDELGVDRSLNAKAEAPPQASVPPEVVEEVLPEVVEEVLPEVVEDARPAEQEAELYRAAERKPEAAEELELAKPKEQPVPLKDARPDEAKWEELLGKVGLSTLNLPQDGVLSRQWLDFLEQLAATNGGTGKANSGKTVRPHHERPRRGLRKDK